MTRDHINPAACDQCEAFCTGACWDQAGQLPEPEVAVDEPLRTAVLSWIGLAYLAFIAAILISCGVVR